MMMTLSYQNQMMEYRIKKQYEYEKKIRLEEIKEKYSNLLIINKVLLSVVRIQRYLRRHFFHEPINKDIIEEIPGLYCLRCKITQLNMIDFYDEKDDNMIISLMESLNINELNNFWIMIDLRIYGENSSLPIYIHDTPYYLSHQQKFKIYNIWNKINPNTRNGLLYKQNLDYQRSVAKDMVYL
jgi:hypothetical protein